MAKCTCFSLPYHHIHWIAGILFLTIGELNALLSFFFHSFSMIIFFLSISFNYFQYFLIILILLQQWWHFYPCFLVPYFGFVFISLIFSVIFDIFQNFNFWFSFTWRIFLFFTYFTLFYFSLLFSSLLFSSLVCPCILFITFHFFSLLSFLS